MCYEEKRLEGQEVFSGRIVTLRVDRVSLPDGGETTREVVEHPGAVAVVAQEPGGRLLFVRQYRYAVGESLLEIPAGKIDPLESPEDCARRELEEETGFRAGSLRKVCTFYTSPGFSNESLWLFFAGNLVKTAPHTDEDEEITLELLWPEEALGMIQSGAIRDAKTITGVLLWMRGP